LDNLDGRQARRTQSSSQLGELFDHGIDSLVMTVESIVICCVGGYGQSWLMVIQLSVSLLPFWLATWEEYHTNILHLGIINGPEEGVWTLISLFSLTYFTGPQIWKSSYKELFGITTSSLPDYPLNTLLCIACLIPLLPVCFGSIHSVFVHLKSNSNQKRLSKQAVQHLITFLIFEFCIITWYAYDPKLWHDYPRIIQCTIGVAFGEMVSRLILAHMCEEPYDFIQRPMIPLIAMVIYEFLTYYNGWEIIPRRNFVIGYLISTWSSYVHFVYNIINELAAYLNIKVFQIHHVDKTL